MIIYTVICRARDTAVLVEESSPDLTGNAPAVTLQLFNHLVRHPKLLPEGENRTFVQRNVEDTSNDFFDMFMDSCASPFGGEDGWVEEHYFHLLFKQGVFYCCIGDDRDLRDQKVNFAFLNQISAEFIRRHYNWRINNANAYALDKAFKPSVRSAMHYHNVNHKSIAREERVQKLLAKVQNMQDVLGRDIKLLLERENKMDRLVAHADELTEDATVFQRRTTRLKRRTQRKYYIKFLGYYCLLAIVLLTVSYFSVTTVCGRELQYCRRGAWGGGKEQDGNNGKDDNEKDNKDNNDGNKLLRGRR